MTTIQQAIPWLDTFQRSRSLEGDVIVLGIGYGEVMLSLGAQLHEGERFVIIDEVNPGIVADVKRINHGRDLIIINEHPYDALKTEALDLERGQYRMVAISDPDCLSMAYELLVIGGLIFCQTAHPPHGLLRVSDTLPILTNSPVWRDDYARVLVALPKEES